MPGGTWSDGNRETARTHLNLEEGDGVVEHVDADGDDLAGGVFACAGGGGGGGGAGGRRPGRRLGRPIGRHVQHRPGLPAGLWRSLLEQSLLEQSPRRLQLSGCNGRPSLTTAIVPKIQTNNGSLVVLHWLFHWSLSSFIWNYEMEGFFFFFKPKNGMLMEMKRTTLVSPGKCHPRRGNFQFRFPFGSHRNNNTNNNQNQSIKSETKQQNKRRKDNRFRPTVFNPPTRKKRTVSFVFFCSFHFHSLREKCGNS